MSWEQKALTGFNAIASTTDNGKPPAPTPRVCADHFPAPPAAEAFSGLAGDIVRTLEPHTEADNAAILIQILAGFGSIIGRTAYFQVEGTRHYLNLFGVLVGQTAKARKGTSWGRVRQIFEAVEPAWTDNRIVNGLSSGEGLIWAVRDPIIKRQPIKEKGKVVGYEELEEDAGVLDKRLFVQEAEFAQLLKVLDRTGNTLSPVVRQAWESGGLQSLTKNSPAKATEAHISIVGHITTEELKRYLSSTEAASGFGNRFIWLAVRRSKLLPEGGGDVDLRPLANRLRDAIAYAKDVSLMRRDEDARTLWHEAYSSLSDDRPGLAGSLLARAEAQTMRLACLYALLDGSCLVERPHLKAALALWDYCERSTRYIFGQATGDPIADEILAALRQHPEGMARTDISGIFSRNQSSDRISKALAVLEKETLAYKQTCQQSSGRPREIWFAV